MGIRDSFCKLADDLRALQGPGTAGFDVIPNQLTIRTRVWSGGLRDVGTPTDTDLVIPIKYGIRQVTTNEIAASNGGLEHGDIVVGPITPAWTIGAQSGGFTPAQLRPPGADGTEVYYIITGSHAGEYQRIEAQTWRPYSYFLVLRRRITTP